MGSHKTTDQINRINERTSQQRYDTPLLVILPLLTEAKRYMNGCLDEHFCEPVDYYDQHKKQYVSKTQALLHLLTEGRSIVTTHALFSLFTPEIESEISKQNYEVIIDEVTNVFQPLHVTKQQRRELLDLKYIEIISSSKRVIWRGPEEDDYYGAEEYKRLKNEILNNYVYAFCDDMLFIVQTPISFFSLCKKYTILTYMFECSDMCLYFKMHNVEYTIHKQPKEEEKQTKQQIQQLIEMIDPPLSIQKISSKRGTHFSSNWWKSRKPEEFKRMRETIGRWLDRKQISKGSLLYASPKSISCSEQDTTKKGRHIQPTRYGGCWIAYNSRATNEYKHKTIMMYMQNVYPNVHIQKYLKENKCSRSKQQTDDYSLSVMLQCVYRTAIREGKPIKLILFSDRMKKLLNDYLYN